MERRQAEVIHAILDFSLPGNWYDARQELFNAGFTESEIVDAMEFLAETSGNEQLIDSNDFE